MLCNLGSLPKNLASVTVDGQPGWVVRGKPQSASRKSSKKKGPTRVSHWLILKGKGQRNVEIRFSLSATEANEALTVAGSLSPAASSRLDLFVPGNAEGQAASGYLTSEYSDTEDRTHLTLALGSAETFSISWRRRRASGEVDSLLRAVHRLTVLPRQADPLCAWSSTVSVSRQKTDRLVFREPTGMSVVRVQGDRVHSWNRNGETIVVLLNEPARGRITINFDGFLLGEEVPNAPTSAKRFALGSPSLDGAVTNAGFLSFADPLPDTLTITSVDGAEEVSLEDASTPRPGSSFIDSFLLLLGTKRELELRVGKPCSCIRDAIRSVGASRGEQARRSSASIKSAFCTAAFFAYALAFPAFGSCALRC